jgi:hypothetical protein
MLGCIKVIISSHSSKNIALISDLSDLLNPEHVRFLHSNEDNLSGGQPSSTRNNLDLEIKILNVVTLRFVDLLMSENSTETERTDATIITAIIGDIVGSFYPFSKILIEERINDPRKAITEKIVADCSQYISNPSIQLSQALAQLIVLRCPVSVADRLNRAETVSKMIEACILNKEEQVKDILERSGSQTQYSDDFSEHFGNFGFTILSTNTLGDTTMCFFGFMDKIISETSALIKVIDKRISHLEDEESILQRSSISKAPIFGVMKRVVDIISPIISTVLGEQCLEKVLLYTTRVYKVEGQLIKGVITSKPSVLHPLFKSMLTVTADN